jgi:hypothetical protein
LTLPLSQQAGLIFVAEIQLFTSSSYEAATIAQPLLTIAMVAELLAMMIALYFLRFHGTTLGFTPANPPTVVLLAASIPILLIFVGIFLFAVALVVHNFHV